MACVVERSNQLFLPTKTAAIGGDSPVWTIRESSVGFLELPVAPDQGVR
jgi:hypothetical protein